MTCILPRRLFSICAPLALGIRSLWRQASTCSLVLAVALLSCTAASGGYYESRPSDNYYLFATSQTFSGAAIANLDNADDIVSLYAFIGDMIPDWDGVSRPVRAVLSTSTINANDRISDHVSTYSAADSVISVYNRNNELLGRWNAPTKTQPGSAPGDFTSFGPVKYDENGFGIGQSPVWTGSLADGTYSGYAANDWTSNGALASYGLADSAGPENMYAGNASSAEKKRIYGLVRIGSGDPVLVWVPEPSTLVLGGGGALGLLFAARRRKSRRAVKHRRAVAAVCLLIGAGCLASPQQAQAVTIPTVPVGNAGNAHDPLTGNLYGSVSYDYRIGTTEVTNAQYAAFLNAKAASDPLGLYDTGMGSDARGGITRSGVSGSYTYAPKTIMADKPVNYVSWYDAIRFANWLHNGQGAGDTETGAYTLLGGTPNPSNGNSITRNAGATWFLPSEDEWYKAAYYQPAAQGGDSDDYWNYPTASNSAPTIATANSGGDISNPGLNVSNYASGADWNSQNGNVTTVGSAGPLSDSFYGTSDQSGNVWEWNEASIDGGARGMRGGSFNNNAGNSSFRYNAFFPSMNFNEGGFRVATVPEPSTAALAIFGCALLFWWRRKRK